MIQAKPPIFLTGRWENLIMINYEADPGILMPYLPPSTVLDTYEGKTLISMVGFLFRQTKVFGLMWPLHTNFEEVNLRFYVKHFDGTVWKRGVVFISEIVPSPVIALLANKLYREPYTAKPMRHSVEINGDNLKALYQWKHTKKWNSMEVSAETSLSNIVKGSEEEFIFEHYWGYNKYNQSTTIEYGVEHDMWQVYTIKDWRLDCDVEALYGKSFVSVFQRAPSSVFMAKGSEVIIRKPRFITS